MREKRGGAGESGDVSLQKLNTHTLCGVKQELNGDDR